MGSVIEPKTSRHLQARKEQRRKGDRLGWKPIGSHDGSSLRSKSCKPRLLTDDNMFKLNGARTLL